MKNTKYILALVSLFLLTAFGQASAAVDCNLKNARVRYSHRYPDLKTTYFQVANLAKSIQIPITDAAINSDLGKMLASSNSNKDVFLNLNLAANICNQIMTSEDYEEFLVMPSSVKATRTITSTAVDCIDCASIAHAPVNLQLPSMKDMRSILDKAAGFSPENINMTSLMLIHLFERMNNKTPNANSLVFTVSLFRALELLKVKTINKDQLQYLASRFKEKLPREQFAMLQKILKQIDSLNFNHSNDGTVGVSIATIAGRPITLTASDIPAADESSREMLKKYFNKVEIQHGTSMVFTDKKALDPLRVKRNAGLNPLEVKSFATPTVVAVQGIKVSGQFPVLGGIDITPKELDIDIDSDAPVKANVGFKKGFVGLSYTFDLNS
ncbi:MAG: hypothetical protein H7177_10315 [Rhizobacter sp.]|nr:hypothetical protein [Bacteriovorax sp.]